MKKIGLIIILLVSIYAVKAQKERIVQNIVLSTPVIDSSKINPDLHFCGIVRDMKLNCLNNEFAQIEDKIWRKEIKIQSEGAQGMEIVFQRFILSSNAIISFYTDSLEYQCKGTYFVHKPDSSYISSFFNDYNCTIVLEIPVNELEKNQIIISQIHHLTESFTDIAIRADYSCMIDANCSEGNDWCDQKRSIAIYFFTENGGRYQCTGALVNNYQNNFVQYFLTARHCTNKVIDWSTTTFYFNYQNTFCNSEDGNMYNYHKVQGSQLIEYCDVSWSDNALLLITEPIPIQYNVYYSGVDITSQSMGNKMTCIHHSKGKPKKIVSGKLQHFAGPKWELYWDDGVIAGGGSGAPVFLNTNKRVVATISGGFQNLDCSNNLKQEWVGKVKSCGDIKDVLFGKSGLKSYSGIDPIKVCQSALNLQGNFYSTHKYDASLDGLTIQTGNTITVSNATFYTDANYTITAENKIVFLPSTIIKAGSNVTAKISPCSGNLISCSNHRSSDNYSPVYYENDDEQINIDEIIVQDVQSDNYFNFTIYPNPNDGNFTIDIFDTEEKRYLVEIFTISGELVNVFQGQTNHLNIHQPDLSDGIYLIKLSIDNCSITKRIILQRQK